MDVQMQIMSAYHEAGHVVVAYWFGATLKSVEMGAHPNTKLQWPNGTTPEALVKGLGSRLIKSTIQELRPGRQRPSSFVRACRSVSRCV